jgi:hypothetical protein
MVQDARTGEVLQARMAAVKPGLHDEHIKIKR